MLKNQNGEIVFERGASQRRVETRVGTKALLKQLSGPKADRLCVLSAKLNQREVGSYLVENVQNMYFAASAAGLTDLASMLELVFYDAYIHAGGSVQAGVKLAADEFKTALRST